MKKLILFDMDGTICLGDRPFDCTLGVFRTLREHGVEYVFLTNNSSHTIDFYVEKIRRMGIECTERNFYTSVETTIRHLEERGIRRIYALTVRSFADRLRAKFEVVDGYERGKPVEAVVAGFDTELTYGTLRDAALHLQDGADFIAANMDWRCPIEDGYYIPDCGGICKCLEMCSGVKPRFLGKPAPDMVRQVQSIFGVTNEETMIVGDRHYTDIMAGVNAGVDSLAVLTGETTRAEFEAAEKKPTYIRESIADLPALLGF